MKISKKGKEFLIQEEGVVLHPYKDQAGIPTIGVGSTYWENGQKVKMTDKPITRERAMILMDTTLKQYEDAVNKALGTTKINQNMFDALVSLCYNIGTDGYSGSTLAKRVRQNPNDITITEAFQMWRNATVGGVKNPILLGRRKREVKLYFTPIESSVPVKTTTVDLNLRSGAGTNYKVVSVLPKGTEVNVLSVTGEWSNIFVCSNKLVGFVSSKYLI